VKTSDYIILFTYERVCTIHFDPKIEVEVFGAEHKPCNFYPFILLRYVIMFHLRMARRGRNMLWTKRKITSINSQLRSRVYNLKYIHKPCTFTARIWIKGLRYLTCKIIYVKSILSRLLRTRAMSWSSNTNMDLVANINMLCWGSNTARPATACYLTTWATLTHDKERVPTGITFQWPREHGNTTDVSKISSENVSQKNIC
jgi:hypothetical protein